MSARPNACPRCGTPLPASAPEGLCPRCLGALNFATETVLAGEERATAQPLLTPAELAVHFPQLEIIECLGRGGMGVVYKARQKSLNRFVALKLLAPERVQDAKFAERFTHEAQALAKLNHPNIVTIHDFGEAGGFYFLLMEFVDGVNLRQLLRARRLTPEEALAIVPPLCDALQFAHDRGIVHRDIKPENLLLAKDGSVKIADFGIAKMLHAEGSPVGMAETQSAGTPGYMAPEQKSAAPHVDSRADIYSLGVVFYEMLTGELPAEKLQPPSRKVHIDVRLDEIVLRALEQTPELRYQTVGEMRTHVETFNSSPRSSRGDEAPSQGKDQGLLTSAATGPRFLKVGTSTLSTPEQLATVSGQFFCYRKRGQLILDDRQLTYSRAGTNTTIPLAAIRDLSIGQYPRMMNPAGIDYLSVIYEEGGQRKQVLLSPMKGWFALPSNFNAHIAEWQAAIREAVVAATGRAPASSPVEKIGTPLHSFVPLLALAAAPVLVGAALMMFIRRREAAGGFVGALGLFEVAVFSVCFCSVLLLNWFFSGRIRPAAPVSRPRRLLGVLIRFAPVLLLGFFFLKFFIPTQSAIGVRSFNFVPVGVSNNVVIVDVTTEVGGGSVELRAELTGPQLSRQAETDLADTFVPPFVGTFIKPTAHSGNPVFRLLPTGRETSRLGFVLPTAALAQDAFTNLHPIGPLPAVPGRTFAGTLFEVSQTDGEKYHASFQVRPPLTSADSNWVSVSAQSQHNESTVTMTWEVLASRPGTARLFHENSRSATQLQRVSKTKLYGTTVRLELTRTGTKSALLVRKMGGAFGGATAREELTGTFRDLADELLRTKASSAETVRDARIVLCQLQGKSFIVQVDGGKVAGAPARPGTPPRILKQGAATGGGLAMLSPIVGEGIGTNVFRSVTTIAQPRHVAVWHLEIKTDNGWSQMPELDLWAVAFEDPAPFSVVAQWNADAQTNGLKGFELSAEALGQRFATRPSRMDWLNDYSWWATPQDRSHWVGPGEWNLNETNQITIFEGVKRDDPNARATIRLNFSLFALPDDFVSALRGNYVYFEQNWRSRLRLQADFPNAAVAVASPQISKPGAATGGRPSIMLVALILFVMVGGGVSLLVLLWRKRASTAAKVLAVLCGVALLLFLLIVGLGFIWLKVSRAEASRAVAAERQAAIAESQELKRQTETWANQMPPPPQMTGPSAGIGVAMSRQNGRFIIGSIVPNTPAARDGRLKAGDQAMAVEEQGRDAVYLDGMELAEVVKLLRGEAGSTVTLHVQPVGQAVGEPVRIRLVRERLETRGQLPTNPPTLTAPAP